MQVKTKKRDKLIPLDFLYSIMELFLVQHALAFSKDQDPTRSITPEGEIQLRQVANYTESVKKFKPEIIYHSGKARAAQTAKILSEYFPPENGVKENKYLAPLENPKKWYEVLKDIDSNLILVGHLPFLENLCNLLISGKPDIHTDSVKFTNAGIVCLEKYLDRWVVEFEVLPSDLL